MIKKDVEGLKTRKKSSRPSEISEDIEYQIKKELKVIMAGPQNNSRRVIRHKEKWNKISLYYIYSLYPSKIGL
jgi:hypothetical protein